MSYLSENSRYKVVLYDDKGKKLPHPYYSLPAYDKKGIGKRMLVYKIIKGKEKDKHKKAFIYDNSTGDIIEIYVDGIKQSKNIKIKEYGKDISKYKIWIILKDQEGLPIIRYSKVNDDLKGDQYSYWQIINNYVKNKEHRNILTYAEIYDLRNNNKRIGRYIRENGQLKGIGKFHKK